MTKPRTYKAIWTETRYVSGDVVATSKRAAEALVRSGEVHATRRGNITISAPIIQAKED